MLVILLVVVFVKTSFGAVLQSGSLVHPKLLEERGLNGERYLRINDDLTLKLEKSTILAKNFALVNFVGNNAETRMVNGTELEKNLYHNAEHMSSLVVQQKDNRVEVEGILKHNLRIHPLPGSERSSDGLIPHEVLEIEHSKVHDKVHRKLPMEARNWNYQQKPQKFVKVPTTYYYEVAIVLDKSYQKLIPGDSTSYVMALMNAVQLRFSKLRRPKIVLIVTGITKISNDDFHEFSGNGINGHNTIERFAKQRKKYLKTTLFDAVLIFTGWDIDNEWVVGYAFLGTVCTINAVAITEDVPKTYSGVHTTTHELCHVLGANHDGDSPTSTITGHPGALNCPYSDNYIMGGYDSSTTHFYSLSSCTENQIYYVLSTKTLKCFSKKSTKNLFKVWKKIAGLGLKKKVYCERKRPRENSWARQDGDGKRNKGNDELALTCQIGCCITTGSGGWDCQIYPLLDGQMCVGKKTCKNGVCGMHSWK